VDFGHAKFLDAIFSGQSLLLSTTVLKDKAGLILKVKFLHVTMCSLVMSPWYSCVARPLFSFLLGWEKRIWNSSQVPLILALPYGMGSVNKRNVMHFELVAACTCHY